METVTQQINNTTTNSSNSGLLKNWSNFGILEISQIFGLLITLLIILIISLAIFFSLKKSKNKLVPTTFQFLCERYVNFFEESFYENSEEKVDKTSPYIFAVINFLLIGNLLSFLGLDSIATSYSTIFSLALIAWIGIFVSGFVYEKVFYLIKFLNPLEIVGKIGPLISISFRIFGNITGGSVIILIFYNFLLFLQSKIVGTNDITKTINVLFIFIIPIFKLYFDLFDALIQSYIFALLNIIYWSMEPSISEEKIAKIVAQRQKISQLKINFLTRKKLKM